MGAIVALPLLIFAILFILGAIEIIASVIILVVVLIKRVKKNKVKKSFYVTSIVLIIIGLMSLAPIYATKLYMNYSASTEIPGFESNKTVNIRVDNKGLYYFKLNGVKYVSLTDALIKDTNWANIDIFVDSFDNIEQNSKNPPIAKVNYKRSVIDRIKDADGDLIGMVFTIFYPEGFSNDYLYTFKNKESDFLITYGIDNYIFSFYVSESKFDHYFNHYSDINNYDLKMDKEDGNNISIELEKTTIDEVTSNAEKLIDFSDEKFSKNVDYKELADEKGLDTMTSHNYDFEDSFKTLYAYNKEIGLDASVAEFYIQDDKMYQAVAIYPDNDESDILLVYIQISDKSRNNLVHAMDNL